MKGNIIEANRFGNMHYLVELRESGYDVTKRHDQGWYERLSLDEKRRNRYLRALEAERMRVDGMTYEAIGKKLGVTKERARQIILKHLPRYRTAPDFKSLTSLECQET